MLRPLANRVVVKVVENLPKEPTRILITKSGVIEAIVIAIGKGNLQDVEEDEKGASAIFLPPDVGVGKKVLIASGAGAEFFFEKESFLIVSEEDILGEF